jgi:hypothetical protein
MFNLFKTDKAVIEYDPRAEAIQKDLDAEHDRQARSEKKKVWSPVGTFAPRRLSEVQS